MSNDSNPPAEPSAPHSQEQPSVVPERLVVVFGIYLIALNLLLLYGLVAIWPCTLPGRSDPRSSTLVCPIFSLETCYLLIVILSGALGSYIHLATSFADYLGNRQLYQSWLWWYVLRPFIGMGLAVIVYFAVRAGLVMITLSNGTAPTSNELNPYTIAAIAGLAGMFSKQATDKLRELFENVLTTKEPTKRSDPLKESGKNEKTSPPVPPAGKP